MISAVPPLWNEDTMYRRRRCTVITDGHGILESDTPCRGINVKPSESHISIPRKTIRTRCTTRQTLQQAETIPARYFNSPGSIQRVSTPSGSSAAQPRDLAVHHGLVQIRSGPPITPTGLLRRVCVRWLTMVGSRGHRGDCAQHGHT